MRDKPAAHVDKVVPGFVQFGNIAAGGDDVVHNSGLLNVG
jgi:hypothetical protein